MASPVQETLFWTAVGRLTSVTNAPDGPAQAVTQYQYDEAGNQTAQWDALSRTTTFEYDSMGRRTKRILPGTQFETLGYDFAGNLIRYTNFNGVIITNQYDVMNRLTNRASVNGYKVSYTYRPTGQRATMTDPSGTTTYLYDNRDRLTNKVVNWGSPAQLSVSLNYGYDANGNLTNLWSSTANGVTNIYQYDALNRLTNVAEQASSLCKYAYDLAGNLQAMRYGNGVTNLYQYDSLNRLTNSVWKLNAGTLASFYYQLGLAGNRTNVIEFVKDSWRTNQWQYDPLYRLTNETITLNSQQSTLNYAYDPVGNRTNRLSSISQLPTSSSSFNNNDWLKTDAYDNNGNTLWSTNGTVQGPYYYDVENRLTTFNNTIYIAYNGDGVRVRKISGTTTNYYLVDDRNPSGYVQVLEEHQALSGQSPALKRVYNYGLDLVSQREAAGTVYYFGYDGHGSTRLLIDTGGTAVQKFSYDAYGTLIDSNAAPATVYLYCGEQFDPDLGFYYLRAPRYLNPGTGRFTTMDTYAGNNEDPLSLHKYLYCQGNPVNRLDPTGLESYVGFNVDGFDGWGHVEIITHNPTTGVYTRFEHAWGAVGEKTNMTAKPLFLGSHILFIIPDQYDSALDTARKNYKKHPGSSTLSNNCRTSVMEIFDAAGVPYPKDSGCWPNSWLIAFWDANYRYVLVNRKAFNFLHRSVYYTPTSVERISFTFTLFPFY